MRFYTFGNAANPSILLLPGTCCHWKGNFARAIELLQNDFYVIAASYDGFDENESTVFPTMIEETEKIENYILENHAGKLNAAYGCSLGGSFVGLLIQRGRIRIAHGILGSSDLDQGKGISAKFQAWLVAKMMHGMIKKGKLPNWMKKRMEKRSDEEKAYMQEMLKMYFESPVSMTFVKEESIRNQFYSDLITPLQEKISAPDTTVHIFYAVKMGKKYEERYRQHFAAPEIIRHDLQHEELLVCYPEKWKEEVQRCCGRKAERTADENE